MCPMPKNPTRDWYIEQELRYLDHLRDYQGAPETDETRAKRERLKQELAEIQRNSSQEAA